MIQKVKGIVLHHIRYKESSAIINMYTDLYGRQAYLVNSIRGRKSKHPGNLLQPLTLLEIEAYHKEGKDLQRLKEIRNYYPYRSIPFDPHKSSQALFLAEVLYKCLREEEADRELYGFLEQSLQLLDISDEGMANFHLVFLLRLTKYLGFYPDNRTEQSNGTDSGKHVSAEKPAFDMRDGRFGTISTLHPDYFDEKSAKLLGLLLGKGFSDLPQISVNQNLRVKFLEDMVDYYRHHVEGFGKLKSLPVLHELYTDENHQETG